MATTAKERQYWDSNLSIDFLTDKSSPQSQRSKTFADLVAEARSGHSDAIHVATALEAKADVLFTYDGLKKDAPISGLLRLNGQMGNPPLRIEVPRVRLGPLFDHGR